MKNLKMRPYWYQIRGHYKLCLYFERYQASNVRYLPKPEPLIKTAYDNTNCFQYSYFYSQFMPERLKVFNGANLAFSTGYEP